MSSRIVFDLVDEDENSEQSNSSYIEVIDNSEIAVDSINKSYNCSDNQLNKINQKFSENISYSKVVTAVFGIQELLIRALSNKPNISFQVCSSLPHISQKGESGENWSCGYRNIQMLCSSLMQIPAYRTKLFNGDGVMPTVIEIQEWIKRAWDDGFDIEGCNQFNGVIVGTHSWIGATECCALLRFFGIPAEIVDIVASRKRKFVDDLYKNPGMPGNGSSMVFGKVDNREEAERTGGKLFQWLDSYFGNSRKDWNEWLRSLDGNLGGEAPPYAVNGNVFPVFQRRLCMDPMRYMHFPPVYFQHQGHSRTIIGYEIESTKGKEIPSLLVYDPAHNGNIIKQSLENYNKTNGDTIWCSKIKRGLHTFKECAYQLVYIAPGFISSHDRDAAKQLISIKL